MMPLDISCIKSDISEISLLMDFDRITKIIIDFAELIVLFTKFFDTIQKLNYLIDSVKISLFLSFVGCYWNAVLFNHEKIKKMRYQLAWPRSHFWWFISRVSSHVFISLWNKHTMTAPNLRPWSNFIYMFCFEGSIDLNLFLSCFSHVFGSAWCKLLLR